MLGRQKLFPSMPTAAETADQPRDDRDLDSAVCCTCLDAPGFSPSASFLSVWGKKKHAAGSAVAAEKVMNLKKEERKKVHRILLHLGGKGKMTFYCAGISGP